MEENKEIERKEEKRREKSCETEVLGHWIN
jgi:hypothetical protein